MPRTLLFCLALTACTSFRPETLVESLRVLDIKSEPAEVASGSMAILTPLVVDLDPNADGRAITYEWALCNKVPPTGVDIATECYDDDVADFITPLPTLAGGTSMFTMPPHTLRDLGTPDYTGGLYVPVRLRISAGTTRLTAFIKVRWANGLQPANQNPMLADLAYIPTADDGVLADLGQVVDPQSLPLDGDPPLVLPFGGKLRFRATAQPGSAETYTTVTGNFTDPSTLMTAQTTELVRFFWYASAGNINNAVTGEARPDTVIDTHKYDESITRRQGLIDLWLVAHDERGGSDFLHRRIQTQ
ncbi:MAG: hypothetical protein ABI321_12900 [Polyangia bacterium]